MCLESVFEVISPVGVSAAWHRQDDDGENDDDGGIDEWHDDDDDHKNLKNHSKLHRITNVEKSLVTLHV